VGLSDQSPSIRFHPLPIRSVIDTPSLDCTGLNYEEITKQVINTIDSIPPEDTIFRLNLLHIPLSMYRSLDFDVIRRHSQTALHYEINARVYSQDDTTGETHVKIEALSKEFSQYMKVQQIQNKEVLGEKGLVYIKKIENLTDDS
jgi:hypothetical protein